MKLHRIFMAAVLSASAVLAEPSAGAGSGQLEFLNGDRLAVRLDGMDAGDAGVVTARSSALRDPFTVERGSLARFIATEGPSPSARDSGWRVELAGGESLVGELAELNADTLVLDSWCAGRMTLPRSKVRDLVRIPAGTRLSGFGRPQDWFRLGPEPEFLVPEGVRLPSGAFMSRDAGSLPALLRLDVEMLMEPQTIFGITLYADEANTNNFKRAFFLTFQGTYAISGRSADVGPGRRSPGDFFQTQLLDQRGVSRAETRRVRCTVLHDRDQRFMWVYWDGERVAAWNDIQLRNFGSVVAVQNQGMGVLEVASFHMGEWDGLPLEEGGEGGGQVPEEDLVRLRNGDEVAGKVQRMGAQTLNVATRFGVLDIPVERIAAVRSPGDREKVAAPPEAVRLTLHDKSVCLLSSLRLADGAFEGVSPSAGPMKMAQDAVRLIEWSLNAPVAKSPSAEAFPGTGRIGFLNGDRLTGLLMGLNPGEGRLMLRHPHIRDPLAVDARTLSRFEAAAIPANVAEPASWRVELANGESYRGEMVHLGAEAATLDLWFSKGVKLPRAQIQSIAQVIEGEILLDGLGVVEDWVMQQPPPPAFTRDSIILPSGAYLSRRAEAMPLLLRLDFSFRWRGGGQVDVLIGADVPGADLGCSALRLQLFGPRGEGLIVQSRNGNAQWVGNPQRSTRPFAAQGVPSEHAFFYDRKNGVARLYTDGVLAREWRDVPQPEKVGPYIALRSHAMGAGELTALRLSQWNGVFPFAADEQPRQERGETLHMVQGESASGALTALRGGAVTLQTDFGALEVPVERIRAISFLGEKQVAVPDDAVRLTLRDGIRSLLAKAELSGDVIKGVSPSAGPLQIPLASVRRIEWRLDAETPVSSPPSTPAYPSALQW